MLTGRRTAGEAKLYRNSFHIDYKINFCKVLPRLLCQLAGLSAMLEERKRERERERERDPWWGAADEMCSTMPSSRLW